MSDLWVPDGKLHLIQGKGAVLDPDGSIAWEEDWQLNTLADEGEESVLNVYLREQSNPSKYLALLTSAPGEDTTMAGMSEVGSGVGYARVQIAAGNWPAPSLSGGDYQTTAAQKTFGPASTSSWSITHVALVTTASGTAGKFLLYVALSASTTIAVGQSFLYTLSIKAS